MMTVEPARRSVRNCELTMELIFSGMIFTTKIREYRCQAKPDKKKIAFSEKKSRRRNCIPDFLAHAHLSG